MASCRQVLLKIYLVRLHNVYYYLLSVWLTLSGGITVDRDIQRAAGEGLQEEFRKLNGCDTGPGDAVITSGYKLPAKHVIYTAYPIFERERLLESCYNSCLRLVKEHELSSVVGRIIFGGFFLHIYPRLMLENFPCTTKNGTEETE
ncbi:Hypothetical predicted protein, partial [Paramuricea clavata]